ncbi:hypothetical protein [Blastomonas sp.]|uniref:hypothetical protein n=1 Tax=Blastomonas sp. TaxID=1909299 RepID=UPI00406A4461
MRKRFVSLILALATLPTNIVSFSAAQNLSKDPVLAIKSVDEDTVLLGNPIRKLVGLMSIVNHGQEDLCIKTDILSNELSPYVFINDDTLGLPHPPLVEGVTRIGQGEMVSFNRVVAFRELDQRKRQLKVRATISAWWCDRKKSVRLRSNIFRG